LDYGWFFLTRRMPWDLSKPLFMDHLKRYVEEKTAADPDFPSQLRGAALKAIEIDDPVLLRRGLTALAFVGRKSDAPQVESLTHHPNTDVAKDARTCLFELKSRASEAEEGAAPDRGGN
jgi:hypothetical protein